jgi:glycerophosphoryl diester phosphodiesterase
MATIQSSAKRATPPVVRRWPRRAAALVAGVAVLAGAAWTLRTEAVQAPGRFVQARPLNIAHGGAQGRAPANTMPAFEQAVELGADALELDVQLSADGHAVVFHDDTVDRATDGTGRVGDLALSELKALDAGYHWTDEDGNTPYRGQGVTIPTLAQVLAAFPHQPVIAELKAAADPAVAREVANVLAARDRRDDVVVASFDEGLLNRFRDLAPKVPTSLAEDEVRTFYTLHLAGLHRWWRPPGVAMQASEHYEGRHVVDRRFVDAADDLGLQVHVWTVNERSAMRRMIELGVEGIITDYPGRLADELDEPTT